MTAWTSLDGKYLKGIMDGANNTLYLYFEHGCFLASSINRDYSYYDNWTLEEVSPPERNEAYKAIGEIASVTHDGDEQDDGKTISANGEKWTAKVGSGSWGPAEDVPYAFLWIRTPTKVIEFSTEYHDCHYPSTIWEVI